MKAWKYVIAGCLVIWLANCGKAKTFNVQSENGKTVTPFGESFDDVNGLTLNNNGEIIGGTNSLQGTWPDGTPQPGEIVEVEAFPPVDNRGCSGWFSTAEVRKVMAPVYDASYGLPPLAKISAGVNARPATLNKVCKLFRCGPATDFFYRKYSSTHDNTILKWSGTGWLKIMSAVSNIKIDNKKNPSKGIKCAQPGAPAPDEINDNRGD